MDGNSGVGRHRADQDVRQGRQSLYEEKPPSGGVSLLLDEDVQRTALAIMEMMDLRGIARRLAERLRAIGIATPLELRDANPRLIRERFSVVPERMVLELRGIASLDLEELAPNQPQEPDRLALVRPAN